MIPLLIFLCMCGMLYAATVETAFGVLMRLPHRIEAERARDHRMSVFLDDPIKLFIPARILRGGLLVASVVLLQQEWETGLVPAVVLLAIGVALNIVLGQVLPARIVRRIPDGGARRRR